MSVVLYEQNNLFIGIIIQGNKLNLGKITFPSQKNVIPYQLSVFQMVEFSLSFFPKA